MQTFHQDHWCILPKRPPSCLSIPWDWRPLEPVWCTSVLSVVKYISFKHDCIISLYITLSHAAVQAGSQGHARDLRRSRGRWDTRHETSHPRGRLFSVQVRQDEILGKCLIWLMDWLHFWWKNTFALMQWCLNFFTWNTSCSFWAF